MEHLHCVAETHRAQRVTLPIDGAMRRVSRKLRGPIVDWNPVDRMYTLDIASIGAVRLRPDGAPHHQPLRDRLARLLAGPP